MIPSKPFDSFKWRWLSVQPTESLLSPPVFLGALRAFAQFEHRQPSDPDLLRALKVVQRETRTRVDLVRTPERNLVRNSGQYWKGTGLLKPDRGTIELTNLGHKVAAGAVTQGEFAAIMVQQAVLPNPYTYLPQETDKWRQASLEIKPLMLILQIIDSLGMRYGRRQAYITPNELMAITIPLSGVSAGLDAHLGSLRRYRNGSLDVSRWPDCTPGSNDKRMAREFLLFLANYGLCAVRGEESTIYDQKFYLSELFDADAIRPRTEASIFDETADTDAIVTSVRETGLPSIIERQRTTASIISRPRQAQFRQEVLAAYRGKCLLTGEHIQEVLEAAHIVPVPHGGDDIPPNGVCLRVDIHRLFDSGNIRIEPGGNLRFSESVASSKNYGPLPRRVAIPNFVNQGNLDWRMKYY